jgi:hypothetical protein
MITKHTAQRTSALVRLQLVAIAVNLGLGLSYICLMVIAEIQGLFWRADFTAYYTGGSMVRDGLGSRLYDLALQAAYQQQILGGRSFSEGLLPYNYPPHTALLFVPLAWVPLSHAFWIWTLAQGILLIWLLRLLQQLARGWKTHERWLLLTATVAFPPMFLNFLHGQFSLWMLICLLQIYLMLKRGREHLAGLWFVLGTFKPQATLLLAGVSLLAARRWRALASAALIGGCLVVLSSMLLGWESWVGFLQVLRFSGSSFGSFGIDPTLMYNFKGTLALIFGNSHGVMINWISGVALIAAAILTFGIWCGSWQPGVPSFELRIALTFLLGLLFSPHLYQHDALMLIAPATLFYAYLRQRQLSTRSYVMFALSCPIAFLIAEWAAESAIGGRLGIRIPTLALIVLTIWVGLVLKNERVIFREGMVDHSRNVYKPII